MVTTISEHDFDLYSVAPAVSSLTLYSDWTKELSDDLHAAVGKVLEKNLQIN